MAFDQVCVVTPSNPQLCQNQDVLFLGTGTVLHMYVYIFNFTCAHTCTTGEVSQDTG